MLRRHKDDLAGLFEDVYLHGHPNPGRVGCPGTEVLRKLAARKLPIDDPGYTHVARCSPCFQELREIQRKHRARVWQAGGLLAASLIVIVMVSIFLHRGGRVGENRQPQEVASLKPIRIPVDLQDVERGTSGARRDIQAPAAIVELPVSLPPFSDGGMYRIALSRTRSDDTIFAEQSAVARLSAGREVVTVTFDLRSTRPGSYWLSTRHDGDDASYYFPVKVK